MSTTLPRPVELPDPPGDPAALATGIDELAAAGFALGVVEVHLAAPATQAPGWLGLDASAAALEVAAAAAVLAGVHGAVTTAIGLVTAHSEVLTAARARLERLRELQAADFDRAERRLSVLVDPAAQMSSVTEPPEATAVVDELVTAEADRATEHAALLAEVAADAVTTSASLTAATAGLGGTGGSGTAAVDAVTLHLAALLPAHGLSAALDLGADAADALLVAGTTGGTAAAIERWGPVLADPVVAAGLVVRLGEEGLDQLLSTLGMGATDDGPALAGLLAIALTAAGSAGSRVPGAGPLLATVLDPDDPDGAEDAVALGMGVVLSAPAVGTGLVVDWARQLVAREAARGEPAGRAPAADAGPLETAMATLAASGDADAAAALLSDVATWDVLLVRVWPDDAAGLASLVELAGTSPDVGAALSAALTSVGAGLVPGGAGEVGVDQGTWAAVAPAVAGLAAGSGETVLTLLGVAAEGGGSPAELAGLSFLVSDAGAASTVSAAVRSAVRLESDPVAVAAVAGALTAVQDQGARLGWLVGVAEAVQLAGVRKRVFDLVYGVPAAVYELSRVPWSGVPTAMAPAVAAVLDMDGRVHMPPDPTPAAGVIGAVELAAALVGTPGTVAGPVGLSAAAGYTTVSRRLHLPDVPLPPTSVPTPGEPPERRWPEREEPRAARPR